MRRIIWINLLLGLSLIISPFLLGYTVSAGLTTIANNIIIGILLVGCSWWILAAMAVPVWPAPSGARGVGVSGFEALCGIWLIVAPFAMHFRLMPHVRDIYMLIGTAVLIVGAIEAWAIARTPIKG